MIVHAILLSLIAGLAITAGAWLASKGLYKSFWSMSELRHFIVAVGGGALISAIAFILIPDGAAKQTNISTLLTFLLGGVTFMLLDILLARLDGRLAQFMAMMLDFIPEAIVLGAVITQSFEQAVFLTIVIATQNLPEGYSAFAEMANDKNRKHLLKTYLLIGLTGPLYIFLGAKFFVAYPMMLGMLMTFCAGGILYLVFEDIAPQAVMRKHWLPPLGAIIGFMVGLSGYLYIHH